MKKSYFILFLFLAIAVNGFSQRNYAFKHFSMQDGLSMNPVISIAQDKKGFLWIGTQDGLNRFDGLGFKVFKKKEKDAESISDNFITCLVSTDDSILWIGTNSGGVNKFNVLTNKATRFLSITHSEMPSDRIYSLCHYSEKILLIGTEKGLGVLSWDDESQKKKFSEIEKLLSSLSVFCIYQDSDGQVWFGTNKGLYRLNSNSGEISYFYNQKGNKSSLSNNIVISIFQSVDEKIWIGTLNGLNLFDGKDSFSRTYFKTFEDMESEEFLNTYSTLNNYSGNTIRSITQEESGKLWIGTDMELVLFNPNKNDFISFHKQEDHPTGINDHFIRSLFIDKSNNLWVGTMAKGLNKLNLKPEKFYRYKKEANNPNSISENYVRTILEDLDGEIWVGTLVGGLNKFDVNTQSFHHYPKTNELSPQSINDHNIWSSMMDKEGLLWFGTNRGISVYDKVKNTYKHFTHIESDTTSLSENTVRSLFQDSKGRIWAGTEGGLNLFDAETGKFKRIAKSDEEGSISNNTIWKIAEDPKDGHIWLATNHGLNKLNPETFKSIVFYHDPNNPQTISNNNIRTLFFDKNQTLWIGTESGLNIFKDNAFERITEEQGLSNNFIYAILEDQSGKLWISTNKGLNAYDKEAKSFKHYDIADGLQDYEFNTNAALKLKNGQMFFGGPSGLNYFDPENIPVNSFVPEVVITSVNVKGKPYPYHRDFSVIDKMELLYNENIIEISFASLDFTNPSNNQFKFKLLGFNEDWIESDDAKAFYTNLNPGEYTFMVMASNSDHLWNQEPTVMKLIIHPPFWLTKWFFTGTILFFIVIGYLGFKWRTQKLLEETRILEAKVKERTLSLEDEKKKLAAVNQELEKLSIVAKETENAIIITNSNFVIEWINEGFSKMYKTDKKPESFYGKSIIETSSNPGIKSLMEQAISEKKSVVYETKNTTEGGLVIYIQSTLTPIFNERGDLSKVVIIDTDITERRINEELIYEKNKDITDSINYASRIQHSILPSMEQAKTLFPEHFVLYKPKDIVSGDFYFIEPVRTNDGETLKSFAVGDCTGHGVPGAFMSLLAINFLKQSLHAKEVNSPAQALDFVSKKINDIFSTTSSNAKAIRDGLDLAFCVQIPKANLLAYAGANNSLYLIRKVKDGVNPFDRMTDIIPQFSEDKQFALAEFKPDKQPIGYYENAQPFNNHLIPVQEGDTVYIFSDGYADQFGGDRGKKFKTSKMKELFLNIQKEDMERQKQMVDEAFLNWKGSLEQVDDICIIGVKI